MQTKINHLQQITNPKLWLLLQIAKPPPSQWQVSSRYRHLHVSPPSTTDLHPRTTPIYHTPVTQRTDAHFASPQSHFAKLEHEWAKRLVVVSGRSATTVMEVGGWERERTREEEEEKKWFVIFEP